MSSPSEESWRIHEATSEGQCLRVAPEREPDQRTAADAHYGGETIKGFRPGSEWQTELHRLAAANALGGSQWQKELDRLTAANTGCGEATVKGHQPGCEWQTELHRLAVTDTRCGEETVKGIQMGSKWQTELHRLAVANARCGEETVKGLQVGSKWQTELHRLAVAGTGCGEETVKGVQMGSKLQTELHRLAVANTCCGEETVKGIQLGSKWQTELHRLAVTYTLSELQWQREPDWPTAANTRSGEETAKGILLGGMRQTELHRVAVAYPLGRLRRRRRELVSSGDSCRGGVVLDFSILKGARIGEASNPGPVPRSGSHRPRGSKPKQVDMVLFNSSGERQLADALDFYRKSRSSEGQVQVAAVIAQEHHLLGDQWVDFQHRSRRCGWKVSGVPATKCSENNRAGVCIAVRSTFGTGSSAKQSDAQPGDSTAVHDCGLQNRLSCAWIDGVLRGGVMVLSLYLWHSEGLSRRNLELLWAAGEVIAEHGGPWILGGDFNMTPGDLAAAKEWLNRIGGDIRAPDVPTCRSLNGGRIIDFLVVDRRISSELMVWTDLSFPGSPHSPVIIRANALATRRRAKMLVRPKALPLDRPIGCSPSPPMAVDAAAIFECRGATPNDKAALDTAFAEVMKAAEAEWCNMTDMVDDEGYPLKSATGRGSGPVYRWLQVVPAMPNDELGRTDDVGLGLSLMASYFAEMAGILARCSKLAMVPLAAMARWKSITALLRKQAGLLQKVVDSDQFRWRWKCLGAGNLSTGDWFAVPTLRSWATEARTALDERRKLSRRQAATRWKDWVEEQLKAGAGALHRFTRRESIVPEAVVWDQSGPTLSLDAILKADREVWAKVWLKFEGNAEAPWRQGLGKLKGKVAPLPALTPGLLREAAGTFKRRTGLGGDSVHPRTFGWLSDEVLEGIARLLTEMEDLGLWPSQVATILMAQIPKAGGGKRPIGLLAGLVRLWERARSPIVQKWRANVTRHYNWAAKGRSPQAAVWLQAFKAEFAAAKGLCSAAALLDLVKAFEMVRLELVWARGLELGFPALILRMVMEIFSFTRRLLLTGAVSDPIDTLSAILAGSGFATDAMFIVLIKPCDTLVRELPASELCLFVDDLTLHVTGAEGSVQKDLTRAVDRCVDMLEEDMGLCISRGVVDGKVDSKAKTFVLASTSKLAKKLQPKLTALGIKVKSKGKMLGIDFSCGRKVVRSAQTARVRKVAARRRRYCMLGRKAASRLVRSGAAPACQYGASVYGTPSSTLKAVRGFACAVRGEVRGRSSFARLELAGYDPGADMAVGPIVEWARAVWDNLVPKDELHLVWKNAHCKVAISQVPFRQVSGPGGAMIASSLRIGWKSPSYKHFINAAGDVLDLLLVCPMQIRLHALNDLRRMEAATSSLAVRIGGAPDLEPLFDYLASSGIRASPAAGALRALGEGGWWGQARLFEEGRVEDPWCKACGNRGGLGPVAGTLHHRMCACEATKELRDNFCKPEVISRAQSCVHGGGPLYQHGVPLLQEQPKVPQHEVRCCGGRQPPEDFVATGNAFTDGAMKCRAPKSGRRAGWAWVVVDDAGDVLFGLYGPCADPFPTAFRAELRAVCELLVVVVPPITIWVDNQELLDGFAKGKQWCCSSARVAADLWRIFWHKLADIGPEGVVLVKTKGHASEADVQAGRSTPFQRKGNDNADHFASRGVDVALSRSPNDKAIAAYKEATSWYKWLAVLCSQWPKDTDPKPKAKRASQASSAPQSNWGYDHGAEAREQEELDRLTAANTRCGEDTVKETQPGCEWQTELHRLAVTDTRCGEETVEGIQVGSKWQTELHRLAVTDRPRGEGTASPRSGLAQEEGWLAAPGGKLDALVESRRLHHSHCFKLTGDLVWCDRCGCYGQARFKALKEACRGSITAKARAGQLAQLRLGRHPITGVDIGKVYTRPAKKCVLLGSGSATGAAAGFHEANRGCRLKRGSRSGGLASAENVEILAKALQKATGRMMGHAFGKLL